MTFLRLPNVVQVVRRLLTAMRRRMRLQPALRIQLDTNCYLGLSWSAIREISAAEGGRHIDVAANRYVLEELLYHLADPQNPSKSFHTRLAAVRKCMHHCFHNGQPIMSPTVEQLIKFMIFSDLAPRASDGHGEADMQRAVQECHLVEPSEWSPELRRYLRFLKARMDAEIAQFATSMRQIVDGWRAQLERNGIAYPSSQATEILHTFEDEDSTRDLRAIGTVRDFATSLGLSLSSEDLEERAKRYRRLFRLAEQHMSWTLREMFEKALDMSAGKNSNHWYDWRILSALVEKLRKGPPITLVTIDENLLKVGRALRSSQIMHLNDYLELLEVSHLKKPVQEA